MFKDCKCGRSIPRQWTRCGECEQARTRVATEQMLEVSTYRDKVKRRHQITVALARLRPRPKVEEVLAKPPVVLATDGEQAIHRIMEQHRIMLGRKRIRKAQHDLVGPALRDWMEDLT